MIPIELLFVQIYSRNCIDEFYHTATVGLHKILSLLQSDDADVRIHAVKVVANLAAEGISE